MTDLIQWPIDAGRIAVSFSVREYWLDTGHHTGYTQIQEAAKSGQFDT
jgi:dTDP-glucose pyrophosphorylase